MSGWKRCVTLKNLSYKKQIPVFKQSINQSNNHLFDYYVIVRFVKLLKQGILILHYKCFVIWARIF